MRQTGDNSARIGQFGPVTRCYVRHQGNTDTDGCYACCYVGARHAGRIMHRRFHSDRAVTTRTARGQQEFRTGVGRREWFFWAQMVESLRNGVERAQRGGPFVEGPVNWERAVFSGSMTWGRERAQGRKRQKGTNGSAKGQKREACPWGLGVCFLKGSRYREGSSEDVWGGRHGECRLFWEELGVCSDWTARCCMTVQWKYRHLCKNNTNCTTLTCACLCGYSMVTQATVKCRVSKSPRASAHVWNECAMFNGTKWKILDLNLVFLGVFFQWKLPETGQGNPNPKTRFTLRGFFLAMRNSRPVGNPTFPLGDRTQKTDGIWTRDIKCVHTCEKNSTQVWIGLNPVFFLEYQRCVLKCLSYQRFAQISGSETRTLDHCPTCLLFIKLFTMCKTRAPFTCNVHHMIQTQMTSPQPDVNKVRKPSGMREPFLHFQASNCMRAWFDWSCWQLFSGLWGDKAGVLSQNRNTHRHSNQHCL